MLVEGNYSRVGDSTRRLLPLGRGSLNMPPKMIGPTAREQPKLNQPSPSCDISAGEDFNEVRMA